MKNRQPARPKSRPDKDEEIVRLEDLAPREEAKGGTRKKLFGQEPGRRTTRRRD